MPVSIKFDWESDPLSQAGDGFKFNIRGAADKLEAWEALRDFSPTTWLGLVRSHIDATEVGPGFFKGTVRYAPAGSVGTDTPVGTTPDPDGGAPGAAPATDETPLGAGFEFQFTADMEHRQQAIRTRYRRQAGDPLNAVGTAEDFQGVVGVSRSGGNVRVEGYDAPAATSVWTKTVPSLMTLKYYKAILSCVGKRNAETFYSFDAGTCVLMGCSGRLGENGVWTLTFTFHVRPDVEDLIVVPDPDDPDDPELPGALVIPFASGWDHIWFTYEEDAPAGTLIVRPKAAYVEKIIELADFTKLRIGA